MRSLIAVFCTFLVTACLSNPTEPTPIDAEITVGMGRTETIASVAVTLEAVTGDSRCPADALCIQGGSATVHVRVTADGRSQAYQFQTGNPQPVRHSDVRVELVQLSPYPFSSRTIQQSEYQARLRLTR